jgi:hypothetical protein
MLHQFPEHLCQLNQTIHFWSPNHLTIEGQSSDTLALADRSFCSLTTHCHFYDLRSWDGSLCSVGGAAATHLFISHHVEQMLSS